MALAEPDTDDSVPIALVVIDAAVALPLPFDLEELPPANTPADAAGALARCDDAGVTAVRDPSPMGNDWLEAFDVRRTGAIVLCSTRGKTGNFKAHERKRTQPSHPGAHAKRTHAQASFHQRRVVDEKLGQSCEQAGLNPHR